MHHPIRFQLLKWWEGRTRNNWSVADTNETKVAFKKQINKWNKLLKIGLKFFCVLFSAPFFANCGIVAYFVSAPSLFTFYVFKSKFIIFYWLTVKNFLLNYISVDRSSPSICSAQLGEFFGKLEVCVPLTYAPTLFWMKTIFVFLPLSSISVCSACTAFSHLHYSTIWITADHSGMSLAKKISQLDFLFILRPPAGKYQKKNGEIVGRWCPMVGRMFSHVWKDDHRLRGGATEQDERMAESRI